MAAKRVVPVVTAEPEADHEHEREQEDGGGDSVSNLGGHKARRGQGRTRYNPQVFSRSETFTPPPFVTDGSSTPVESGDALARGRTSESGDDDLNHPAAGLMHQSTRDGKQQTAVPHPSPSSMLSHGGSGAGGATQYGTVTVEAEPLAPPRRTLWQRMCCCFMPAAAVVATDLDVMPPAGRTALLGPIATCDIGRKCLVVDLDETLVHSSFRPVPAPDYVIPVEIDGTVHHVYVVKRPGCDEFLQEMGRVFEVVIFTASLAKYADPLLDQLDVFHVVRYRLFRESCIYHDGNYVKDLNLLGRSLRQVIIVDNSPASFMFHTENAVECETFIDDMTDTELLSLIPFLAEMADMSVTDVRPRLREWAA